jgi:hypothetical protein
MRLVRDDGAWLAEYGRSRYWQTSLWRAARWLWRSWRLS